MLCCSCAGVCVCVCTRVCVYACVCVPTDARDGVAGVKEPDLLPLCCVSDCGQVTTSVSLIMFSVPLQDRGAVPGSGSALALQARVQPCLGWGADTDRRGPGSAWRDRLRPSGQGQGRTDCRGFLSKSRLYGNKVI